MATETRQQDREFDISGLVFGTDGDRPIGGWEGPLGITSDGKTMWVASDAASVGNRLYALDMSTGDRKPEAEIALGRFRPRGLYSDGRVLWTVSTFGNTVRAYDISTRARVKSLELDLGSDGHWGLWSDGDYMWALNFRRTTVKPYSMPEAYGPRLARLEVSGVDLVVSSPITYRGRATRGTESVTVTAAAADDSLAVTFGTDDADGMVEGHQWDLALGDNTLQITVSDGTVSRVYTVTVRKVDADILSDDATLSVDGAAGHQVALAVGPNRVRVAVDATDGRGRAEYTLTIGRSGSPFARMPSLDLGMTLGSRSVALWSDRSTVWTSLPQWDILAAFSLSSGKHRRDRDNRVLGSVGNRCARGIWSDGNIMWVADFDDNYLYAYAMPAPQEATQQAQQQDESQQDGSAPAGELGLAVEPAGVADLAQQGRCCDRADARFVAQGGSVFVEQIKVSWSVDAPDGKCHAVLLLEVILR